MPTLVAKCPRCDADRMTFEVKSSHLIATQFKWKEFYETFSICRRCNKATNFVISLKSASNYERSSIIVQAEQMDISPYFDVEGRVSLKDDVPISAPEHLPEDIQKAFEEGARCISVNCWNAAGTMFRMALDLATRPLLPPEGTPGINRRQRRDLGMRLPWLFDNQKLPEALRGLSTEIHQDGNDGAHQGTLTKAEALDLLDFAEALLTRLYTEPARLRQASERRAARRAADQQL